MIESEDSELGETNIDNDVLGIVAGISATEVDGVAAMSSGFAGDIAEMLGRKNLSRGVSLEETEEGIIVDLNIIVEFEVKISEVAREVQKNVKESLEEMTGVNVEAINVNVLGIDIPDLSTSPEEDELKEEEEKIAGETETEEGDSQEE